IRLHEARVAVGVGGRYGAAPCPVESGEGVRIGDRVKRLRTDAQAGAQCARLHEGIATAQMSWAGTVRLEREEESAIVRHPVTADCAAIGVEDHDLATVI